MSRLLSSPFYYGHFKYAGEVHEGKHEPLISKALFDKAQDIINARWRWTPKDKERKPQAFMGLMRCAGCGSAITAEVQKGHTYYRCTKKGRGPVRCAQPYVREEVLDAQISNLLKPFALRADWADAMLERVKTEKKQSAQSAF